MQNILNDEASLWQVKERGEWRLGNLVMPPSGGNYAGTGLEFGGA
jgi:hypothetical protein